MSENTPGRARQGQQRRLITFFIAIFTLLSLVIGAGIVVAGATEKASQQAIDQPPKSGDRSGARDVPPWMVKHDNRLSDVPPPPCTPGWRVEDYDIRGYSLSHVDGAAANDV